MGRDRRKIENRYKSGNKSLATWSFNLGFSYVHHQCSTGHRVKFQLFWIGIFSLEIIFRFIISKLSRLVSEIRKKLMKLIIEYPFFQKIRIQKICYFTA